MSEPSWKTNALRNSMKRVATESRTKMNKTTTEAGHTKGRWGLRVSGHCIEVKSESKTPIVNWNGFDDSDRSRSEHIANAQLIAQAPELLRQRDEILASMTTIVKLLNKFDRNQEEVAVLSEARRAIANATNKGTTE